MNQIDNEKNKIVPFSCAFEYNMKSRKKKVEIDK